MAIKKAYLVDGHPFHVDNVGGLNCVVDHSTGEIIATEGKDYKTPSDGQKWCDRLNVAWSDGFRVSKLFKKD